MVLLIASRISDKIFLCDILESNRAEVQRFRTNAEGAHDFSRYFDFVVALEETKDDLEARTRNAIEVGGPNVAELELYHFTSLFSLFPTKLRKMRRCRAFPTAT